MELKRYLWFCCIDFDLSFFWWTTILILVNIFCRYLLFFLFYSFCGGVPTCNLGNVEILVIEALCLVGMRTVETTESISEAWLTS